MLDVLRAAALLAATMTMGIEAGVFQLYTFAIMPGLGRTDDRTFVGAFQQIDRAIIGPWLFLFFFGALGFTALAAAFHLGADERSALGHMQSAVQAEANRDKLGLRRGPSGTSLSGLEDEQLSVLLCSKVSDSPSIGHESAAVPVDYSDQAWHYSINQSSATITV